MNQNTVNRRAGRSTVERCKLWIIFILALLMTGWLAAPYVVKSSEQPELTQTRARVPLFVRGYIAVQVGRNVERPTANIPTPFQDVYLPGIKVFLEDASTNGMVGDPVVTDLSGRFTLFVTRPGRYRVCWKSQKGFRDGCSHDIYSVGSTPINASTVRITPDRRDKTTVVYGKVQMKDGSRPRVLEPFLNLNKFARVTLLDGGNNEMQQVFVNNFGDYLLPQVPVSQSITIRAEIDGGVQEQHILPEANLAGAPFHSINLKLGNTPPRLDLIFARDGAGQRLKVARPGGTVILESKSSDKDGDPLKYIWRVAEGSGSLSGTDTPQVKWKLPTAPGRYSVALVVTDNKGGYAKSEISMRVDNNLTIPFSGKVDATDSPVVAGAEVEVNGQVTNTDPNGLFKINVPDAKRFVLNIRKPGFGLVSRIYDDGVTGGHWTMNRATITTVDPTKPMRLVDKRNDRNCPGPLSDQMDWRDFLGLAQPEWQDGKGNVVQAPTRMEDVLPIFARFAAGLKQVKYQCGPGIQVDLPANSLRDRNGLAPSGSVQISVSTVDLRSPDQMPGDYTVKLPGGVTRVMESYGAGTIEVTSGGRRYNLKPNTQAKVTIPVDPSQLAAGGALPPTIPILFYNEREGVWEQDGTATLQGNAYVTMVKHFSAINTDTIKVNQSCVRVNSPSLPASYKLEVTIPLGGGAAPKVLTRDIDQSSTTQHVLYNLPSNTNIVLVPIRSDTNLPIGTFVVNTGGPQNPTTPNLPAGPPYNACSTEVTLHDRPVPDAPVSGEFLHGLYSFEATNLSEPSNAALVGPLNQATDNYYAQIDPRGKRATLEGATNSFRSTNGFDVSETNVFFANSGDLGFGRDMHCTKRVADDGLFDVACYVTNYGDIDTPDLADSIAARDHDVTQRKATVAMEYSRIENLPGAVTEFDPGASRVVKFYVYSADGSHFLRSANLDGLGERPIPQLCMVCHNGNYPHPVSGSVPPFNNRDDVNLGSRFLPFDLHFYTFPSAADKTNQQAAFRTLNEDIVKNTPPDATAIAEIINSMYAGPPGSPQDENFFVTGWSTQPIEQGMYRDVVARTCRTCHAANVVPSLQFTQSAQAKSILGAIESRVCLDHVMPHARITHRIFWQSVGPHMPAQLQVFGDTFHVSGDGWTGTRCGEFTPGGSTPVSFYESTIQPIWDNHCTVCHAGNSPPQGLNLTSGASYGLLVNHASSELPSMNRITPNDTAHSYLFHKINGTQSTVGGFGSRMPQGCPGSVPCLNSTETTTIQSWINSGALGP